MEPTVERVLNRSVNHAAVDARRADEGSDPLKFSDDSPVGDILRPGQLWARYDKDYRTGVPHLSYTIAIVSIDHDPDFVGPRYRCLEFRPNGRVERVNWSPPCDGRGLRTFGYRRLV